MQMLFAGLLVAGCSAFAVWSLAPAGLRQRLAALLARWPGVASRLVKSAEATACGGCKGCAVDAPAAAGRPSVVAPIVFHRR